MKPFFLCTRLNELEILEEIFQAHCTSFGILVNIKETSKNLRKRLSKTPIEVIADSGITVERN